VTSRRPPACPGRRSTNTTPTATHDDPEVANIFATAPNRGIHELLEGSNQAVAEITAHYLEPMLEQGRRGGELRTDVTSDQIVAWIRGGYAAFSARLHVEEEDVRTMMRLFLVPSLPSTPGPARPGRRSP
jgi:hypothetical protein